MRIVKNSYPKKLFNPHKDLPFLPERKKNRKSKKTCLIYRRQGKICCSYKSFKKGIKTRINILKSTQSNSV